MITPEKLQEVEAKIRAAIKKAEAAGIPVRPYSFGVLIQDGRWAARDDGCCPLSTTIIGTSVPGEYDRDRGLGLVRTQAIIECLGISRDEAQAFMVGYDYPERILPTDLPDWYIHFFALGSKFREEAHAHD